MHVLRNQSPFTPFSIILNQGLTETHHLNLHFQCIKPSFDSGVWILLQRWARKLHLLAWSSDAPKLTGMSCHFTEWVEGPVRKSSWWLYGPIGRSRERAQGSSNFKAMYKMTIIANGIIPNGINKHFTIPPLVDLKCVDLLVLLFCVS